jgi:branched-chain amino acid aminotransferase
MAIVYFKDGFVDEAEANIPITTHALHYGTAVFEGIRAYGDGTRSAIFRPLEHNERLLRNAAWLEMAPRFSAAELTELTVELLRRNQFLDDRYIRPLLFKSAQVIGAGLPKGDALAIMAVPMPRGTVPRPATSGTWSRWRRFSGASCPAGAKITGLYVNSSLARAEAISRGFDQPILLNASGEVAEGYGANIFVVIGSRVVTPPAEADILPGITRDTLMRYFDSRRDLTMSVEPVAPALVARADEIFLCGTGIEILPISTFEGQPIGDGSGRAPIAEGAARWYRDVVTGAADVPEGWLVPVS